MLLGRSASAAASARATAPACPPGALCLLYGNGAEPATLDPAQIDGVWEGIIVSQLIVGLTDIDADGKPVPGVAKSWETSPDGLTWTFHLRDAKWSDGVAGDRRRLRLRHPARARSEDGVLSAFILFPF